MLGMNRLVIHREKMFGKECSSPFGIEKKIIIIMFVKYSFNLNLGCQYKITCMYVLQIQRNLLLPKKSQNPIER